MPLARISLLKGKSSTHLQSISDAVHHALVHAFEAPPDDRFQVIHQHEPHELIYDRHYQGGPRTQNWILVCITAGRPRTRDAKLAFYSTLVEQLGRAADIGPEDVMVVIKTTQPDEWSFGGGRILLPPAEHVDKASS